MCHLQIEMRSLNLIMIQTKWFIILNTWIGHLQRMTETHRKLQLHKANGPPWYIQRLHKLNQTIVVFPLQVLVSTGKDDAGMDSTDFPVTSPQSLRMKENITFYSAARYFFAVPLQTNVSVDSNHVLHLNHIKQFFRCVCINQCSC